MAYAVIAYTVLAYAVIAYTVMAYTVMACTAMACTVMAYTVMADTVMAYTVMAYMVTVDKVIHGTIKLHFDTAMTLQQSRGLYSNYGGSEPNLFDTGNHTKEDSGDTGQRLSNSTH